MAGKGKQKGQSVGAATAAPGLAKLATLPGDQLPPGMPPEMFTPPGMLAIADFLPVMTAFVDRELRYRFVNHAFAEWFEQPRKTILGSHMRDVMGAQAFAGREAFLEAALAGERQWFAATFDHPQRGPVALHIDYVPWTHDGEVRGIVIVLQDVTEQRVAERALRESEARFRRIANQAPALMWVTRLDRTRDFVNDAYMEYLGTDDREFARNYDWRNGIHPDDVDRIVAESIAGETSGKTFALEGRFRRGDGEYRWLKSVSSPRFGPDGELVGFIGVATDITLAKEAELELRRQVEASTAELLRAQEQLRQSQKMEALGQLTGGIAHDFNNLLTVVVGGLDVVAKRVEDSKLKRYAVNALTAAERGARLTGQLLAFSRVQRLEVRPVHVSPLVQNMRPLLRNVLGPGITKEFDLDDSMMPVMADPTQLEVAILNLAINARDAMPEGGVLKFVNRPVAMKGDPELDDGDYMELAISDTGTGMAPEVAARAFEPFFTTKDIGKGTGLGLSMVYGMARQSGGAARIDTAPGKGTAVKLYFKAADARPVSDSADEPHEAGPVEQKSASILVIDDDPDVRGFIAEALAEEGYRVRDCADGREGLRAFAKSRPDLVVLDFIMPAMSGADVARAMLGEVADQKILFVSGYSETEAIRKVAPDSAVLPKPFRSDALIRAVRNALA